MAVPADQRSLPQSWQGEGGEGERSDRRGRRSSCLNDHGPVRCNALSQLPRLNDLGLQCLSPAAFSLGRSTQKE
jgi:hypothetical protein